MLYAYRIRLYTKNLPDEAALPNHRARVQGLVRQFGGDPLGNQELMAIITGDFEVTVMWRLQIEARNDLIDTMVSYAQSLSNVDHWVVEYHRCYNAQHRPCDPWQLLREGTNP